MSVSAGMSSARRLLTHRQSVRLLYKSVLRLHRGMPIELKAIGDQYARDEFRRHKQASAEETAAFMTGWAEYVQQLSRQLGVRGLHQSQPLGTHLSENQLDQLRDEQLHQLHELLQEAQRPSDQQLPPAGTER